MNKPYYILSPSYQSNSGGIKVLYELVKRLNARGQRAYIVNGPAQVPVDAIAVYPEIYKGNPFGCKTVARYVLNSPGKIGGDKVYDDKELVFVFDYVFLKDVVNEVKGMLYIPCIELDLFYDRGWDRTITSYYVGKGPLYDYPLPRDCFNLSDRKPSNREELANVLNKSKVLYCFDYATMVCQEAALCGCPTVILSKNLEEHKKGTFKGYGMCDDISRIQEAKDSMHKVKEVYDYLLGNEQLDNFIKITQRGK